MVHGVFPLAFTSIGSKANSPDSSSLLDVMRFGVDALEVKGAFAV